MPVAGELVFAAPRRAKPPRHLADLTPAERREVVEAMGERPFRADQLATHYFAHLLDDPAAMTDVPARARGPLAAALLPTLLTPVRHLDCDGGMTRKTVWRLFDGATVESVLMRYPGRVTMCVSSQAGCGMNCPFCATGQAGLTRNMSAGEIVDQVVAGARWLRDGELGGATTLSTPPTRCGSPTWSSWAWASRWPTTAPCWAPCVASPTRRRGASGISQRSVTVSTVGLVPAMDKLTAEGLSVTLALSLHAPDDELRDTLVPVNTRWKVAEVLDAARRYFEATGRRVSIEYALIRDINDHAWRADLLGTELNRRGRGWVHVNPIPLNPTPGSRWTASDPQVERTFVQRLRAHGIPTTVRDTRGREIDGACGQLAAVTG